jgi:CRISPR-associated protein (TIGR03984 family)
MNPVPLFIYTAEKLTLITAIQAFRSVEKNQAVSLFYTPFRCCFGLLNEDGTITGANGESINLSSVFEARLFSPKIELRWLNDPSHEGEHQTAILAETELAESAIGDPWKRRVTGVPQVVGTLEQTYLLWGEGTGNTLSHGWSELATARIGALPVPIGGVRKNERVILHAREYLAEYNHGNVAVLDERLVKLEVEGG